MPVGDLLYPQWKRDEQRRLNRDPRPAVGEHVQNELAAASTRRADVGPRGSGVDRWGIKIRVRKRRLTHTPATQSDAAGPRFPAAPPILRLAGRGCRTRPRS